MTHLYFALVSVLALAIPTAAAASTGFEHTSTLVHDTTTTVDIELNTDTVICSHADYGATFLKILIPELAGITLLDHQNFGAGAPCVAAGMCLDGNMPEDIVNSESPSEEVAINVKALRREYIDHDGESCTVSLTETVDVEIRGKTFKHERWTELPARSYSDCLLSLDGATEPAPGSDPGAGQEPPIGEEPADVPADQPYGAAPVQSPAGCSAGGGASQGSWMLLLGLAAIAIRRRRV